MLRLLLPAAAAILLAAAPAVAAPRAKTALAERAQAALAEVEDLRDGRGVRTGRELTLALHDLAVGARHLRGSQRARANSLLARPTDGDAPDDERYDRPEAPAVCSTHFCVHSETGTNHEDAVAAGFPDQVLQVAEDVYAFENGALAWRTPPSDSPEGGDGRVDIYLKELSAHGMFGFAASDPLQDTQSQHAYLVLDNDFDPTQFNGVPALSSLRLTLAHEYGHVLQYGYDVTADTWHLESSAIWLEHRFDSSLDDWLSFVYDSTGGPGWRSLTELPLTASSPPDDERPADYPDVRDVKPYGTAVWNHFLSSRYGSSGDAVQRAAWEASKGYTYPSTRSYDVAIKGAGGTGLVDDFVAFSAAAAEWRVPSAGFALPSQLPDIERRGTLAVDGATASTRMDHLTFAFYDVPTASASRIRFAANFPAGVQAAVALVARKGSTTGGEVTTKVTQLPAGGPGGVTLDDPGEFFDAGGRITAVLVNADPTTRGYASSDWAWSWDAQPVSARVTTDLSGPSITTRSPGPNARRVATDSRVRVSFSKPVTGVTSRSFSLRRPDGRAVPARVAYARSTRTATLTPTAELTDTTRYSVRLTSAIVDDTATTLAPQRWSFTTVRRAPLARVRVLSAGAGGARVLLRSTDRDRLRWSARLVRAGRVASRDSGSLRPGRSKRIGLAGRAGAPRRVVVLFRDPQGNRTRVVRALR